MLKFYKIPIKFRNVIIGCNTYSNIACNLLLNILTKIIYYIIIDIDNIRCIKKNFHLANKLKNVNNINLSKPVSLLIYLIILKSRISI